MVHSPVQFNSNNFCIVSEMSNKLNQSTLHLIFSNKIDSTSLELMWTGKNQLGYGLESMGSSSGICTADLLFTSLERWPFGHWVFPQVSACPWLLRPGAKLKVVKKTYPWFFSWPFDHWSKNILAFDQSKSVWPFSL